LGADFFLGEDAITFALFCLVILTANIGDFIVALFDADASWFVDFFIVIGMFLFSWFRSFYCSAGGTISALGTQWVNTLCRIVPIFYANFTMMMRRKTDEVEKPRYCRFLASLCRTTAVSRFFYLISELD